MLCHACLLFNTLLSCNSSFSHWKPLGFKVWKDSQCLSFFNAFFENMYTLNVKLKFLPNKEMFDHCLKLKFKSRTQVVWRNASSEYWTCLLRCFWPMQLIAPIVKFLLLISKKKNYLITSAFLVFLKFRLSFLKEPIAAS